MNLLRSVPAAILAGAAAVLSGSAKLAEMGARRLAGPAQPADTTLPSPGQVADAASERVESAGTAVGDAISTAGQDLGERVQDTASAAADTVQDAGSRVEETASTVQDAGAAADTEADEDLAAAAGTEVVTDPDLDPNLGAGADLAVDADVVTDADLGADTTSELPPQPDDTGVVVDLPPSDESPVDEAGGQVRTYESHIAELAEQNVSAGVRGVQRLSTEELGQLFDYESAHRKRKTVLQAIERAAAPEAEETVYTTESPDYEEGNPPL